MPGVTAGAAEARAPPARPVAPATASCHRRASAAPELPQWPPTSSCACTFATPDSYAAYRAAVPAVIARFGGRYLVRGGAVEALEGSYDGSRVIVFEFPDMTAIHAMWNSSDYAEVRKLRAAEAPIEVWAVPGYQP
jgi:uncharacterized protein (DUF1330 family)